MDSKGLSPATIRSASSTSHRVSATPPARSPTRSITPVKVETSTARHYLAHPDDPSALGYTAGLRAGERAAMPQRAKQGKHGHIKTLEEDWTQEESLDETYERDEAG